MAEEIALDQHCGDRTGLLRVESGAREQGTGKRDQFRSGISGGHAWKKLWVTESLEFVGVPGTITRPPSEAGVYRVSKPLSMMGWWRIRRASGSRLSAPCGGFGRSGPTPI